MHKNKVIINITLEDGTLVDKIEVDKDTNLNNNFARADLISEVISSVQVAQDYK